MSWAAGVDRVIAKAELLPPVPIQGLDFRQEDQSQVVWMAPLFVACCVKGDVSRRSFQIFVARVYSICWNKLSNGSCQIGAIPRLMCSHPINVLFVRVEGQLLVVNP